MGRRFVIISLAIAAAVFADDQPSFESLPARVQEQINERTREVVVIGPELWSIAVQLKKHDARDRNIEAYTRDDAPAFIRLRDGLACANIEEATAATPGYERIEGIIDATSDGKIIFRVGGRDSIAILNARPLFIERLAGHSGVPASFVVSDNETKATVFYGGEHREMPARECATATPIPATPDQVYAAMRDNAIKGFPIATPTKRTRTVNRVINPGPGAFRPATAKTQESYFDWQVRWAKIQLPASRAPSITQVDTGEAQ